MSYKYNKKLVSNAKTLRKNMTPEERHLYYDFLKRLPVTVNRQKNIGNYIVDFFIAKYKIVIELDGSQHSLPKNKAADHKRDEELYRLGIKVLRYTNRDINTNFSSVCDSIMKNIGIEWVDLKPYI